MSGDPLAKADGALRERLARAAPDEEIIVVLELAVPPLSRPAAPLGGTPQAVEARRASRESFASAMTEHTGDTVAELERMGLSPRGGRYMPYVVVRGPAHRIRDALALDGIASATLDTTIALPDRPGKPL